MAKAKPGFRPLRDHILVLPVNRLGHFGASRIIVVSDEQDTEGQVVAVGKGGIDEAGRRLPMSVKVGDHVRYGNGSYLKFTKIDIKGVRHLVMREADICWIEPRAA